jgi:hypothetical protein
MDQQVLQGWHDDPFGRHERRYFSAGQPTKLVRDGGIEAYDEPPASQTGPAVYNQPPAPTDYDQPRAWQTGPAAYDQPPPEMAFSVRKRRTGLVNATVAGVTAAAVVVAVAIAGGFRAQHGAPSKRIAPPGVNLAAFVRQSVKSTLDQKTADVTVTATFGAGGTTVAAHGTGQIDFAANTAEINFGFNAAGTSVAEDEIVTSRALYLRLTVNGQSATRDLGLGSGQHWVKLPLSESLSDPRSSLSWNLQMLAQQGGRVVRGGTRDIGGLTCDEYVVTPTKQAMIAAARQEWARLGLPSSETAAALQALESLSPPSVMIWLDRSRHLTCQVAASVHVDMGSGAASVGGAPTVSAQMLLTFTHYGVPVHITAPPPSDTVSFQQPAGGF